MHITGLCTYPVCHYAELLPIEIAYFQMGPMSSYAVKRIMQLCGMHLSGVHCRWMNTLLYYSINLWYAHMLNLQIRFGARIR